MKLCTMKKTTPPKLMKKMGVKEWRVKLREQEKNSHFNLEILYKYSCTVLSGQSVLHSH